VFELLNDRRPEIKWWTLPSMLFIVLCLGVDIGIMIGRRSLDILQWAQIAFIAFVAWWIVSPILKEIKTRTPVNDNHGE